MWNGRDPIPKERLDGLTHSEGNHGEDVKQYDFDLDSTPTHSYMRYLDKYPQAAFPYADLIETNRWRGRGDFEYELLDTGVFADNRYFDVFVEYAKASPKDVLIAVSVHNRGPEAAELHLLPTLWFRNPATQEAMTGELLKIAGQCDGVRCDMAMLVLPEAFQRSWGAPARRRRRWTSGRSSRSTSPSSKADAASRARSVPGHGAAAGFGLPPRTIRVTDTSRPRLRSPSPPHIRPGRISRTGRGAL